MIVKNFMGAGGEQAEIFITGLSSTDTVGATSPSGKSISASWIEKPILPSGYTELDYIESSGTQYGWSIPCKEYGTYTVTATNGTKTATENVLVDAVEVYEISMIFILYIFKANEINDATLAFKQANRTVSISNASIYETCSNIGYSWAIVRSTNLIDLSSYSKICIDFEITSKGSESNFEVVATDSTGDPSESPIATWNNQLVSRGVYEVDISSISSSKYVAIKGGNVNTLNVYNWWLE